MLQFLLVQKENLTQVGKERRVVRFSVEKETLVRDLKEGLRSVTGTERVAEWLDRTVGKELNHLILLLLSSQPESGRRCYPVPLHDPRSHPNLSFIQGTFTLQSEDRTGLTGLSDHVTGCEVMEGVGETVDGHWSTISHR